MAKILIIDDENEFTDMVALRLNKTGGYETLCAYDGEEGLKLAREKRPDLVLLDVMLPKMDGFEVMQKLKTDASAKSIPVIILSASVAPSTMEKFLQLGAVDYIAKPFEPHDLMEKVAKALADY